MSEPDYKKLLINLLASMSLADHKGDIADDAFYTIKLMGIELPDSVDCIDKFLPYFVRHHGATTVYGSEYNELEYDEDYEYIGDTSND